MEKKSRREFLKLSSISLVAGSILSSCEYDNSLSNDLIGKSYLIDLNDQMSDALYPNPDGEDFPPVKRSILQWVGAGFSKRFEGVNYGIPVIISRIKNENKEDDFACFSSLCTHNNCIGIRPSLGQVRNNRHIVCQCHSSRFDAFSHGVVIQGPAEIPLKEFKTKFYPEKNQLEIFF
jgi:Rieske Fe-S protein